METTNTLKGNGILGIVREEKSFWERRVPLPPNRVAQLVQAGIKVLIQPSTRRCYADKEYEKVGAVVTEDLSPCNFIIGVKEIPIENLMSNRSYLFFSHTIKGQPYNMPLLDIILEKNIRLFDYEVIKDSSDQRLVAFGRFAGCGGAIGLLRGMGQFLINRGLTTPFLHVGSAYMYPDLATAKKVISGVGEQIKENGLPEALKPLVIGITSKGRVAQGCYEVLSLLPHKLVTPEELEGIFEKKDFEHDIYITYIEHQHMVAHKDGKPFDKKEYYQHFKQYKPIFHEKYLKYYSVLANCMYWNESYPRMVTDQQMKFAVEAGESRLFAVTDITCDFEGSIQFLKKFTSIQEPFYVYDPANGNVIDGALDAGKNKILFHAVDHIPAELPKDASDHFGEKLVPFMEALVKSDGSVPYEEQDLIDELKSAMICTQGQLSPSFKYISEIRKINESKEQQTFNSQPLLKKSLSSVIFKMEGHLFDTKAINDVLDLCERKGLHFTVQEWNVGLHCDDPSSIVIKVFSKNVVTLDEAIEELGVLIKDKGVQIVSY